MEKLAYSVKEAAEALSISATTLKEEIYQGRITAVKFGRRTVIPRWALEERLLTPEGHSHDRENSWNARDHEPCPLLSLDTHARAVKRS